MPITWQGWSITLAFVLALAATVPLHGDGARDLRIGICGLFVGVAYFTYERRA